jgi:hypothetical protein
MAENETTSYIVIPVLKSWNLIILEWILYFSNRWIESKPYHLKCQHHITTQMTTQTTIPMTIPSDNNPKLQFSTQHQLISIPYDNPGNPAEHAR